MMADALRQAFVLADAVVRVALDPRLLKHRSRIFREHFRDPMELK